MGAVGWMDESESAVLPLRGIRPVSCRVGCWVLGAVSACGLRHLRAGKSKSASHASMLGMALKQPSHPIQPVRFPPVQRSAAHCKRGLDAAAINF